MKVNNKNIRSSTPREIAISQFCVRRVCCHRDMEMDFLPSLLLLVSVGTTNRTHSTDDTCFF